jgi:hypothetical protein
MGVQNYDLDREVFRLLNVGKDQVDEWQGESSGIADYVTSWGIERFWATSRSARLLGGKLASADAEEDKRKYRYFAWDVARQVLCLVVGKDLEISNDMKTVDFQERLKHLNFNQQILLTDLLIEISDTVQFWTMRIKEVNSGKNASKEPV